MAVTGHPIVVFGGTFDPVHNGHIAVAQELRETLAPCTVLMVPTGKPWLRSEDPAAASEDRLKMVELALEAEPGIEASDVDVSRKGDTYSLDTLQELRLLHGSGREYHLAIGADSAETLHLWHQVEELLQVCKIVVVDRPGYSLSQEASIFADARHVDGPMIDLSASSVREAYRQGNFSRAGKWVPEKVHRFIMERGIYR